jgi:hypothetical protein
MDATQTQVFGKYTFLLFPCAKVPFTHRVEVRAATPKARVNPYKIEANYGFRSLEQAEAYIDKTVANLKANAERRAERKAEAAAEKAAVKAEDFFKVGDIVYNSWGYEQTNIEFYRVTKVLPKSIELKQLCLESVPNTQGMDCEKVVAGKDFYSKGSTYTLRVKPSGHLSAPERFYHFSKWDGRALYRSWYY